MAFLSLESTILISTTWYESFENITYEIFPSSSYSSYSAGRAPSQLAKQAIPIKVVPASVKADFPYFEYLNSALCMLFSEMSNVMFVAIRKADSNAPAAPNAQQDPSEPWSLTGVTSPWSLRLKQASVIFPGTVFLLRTICFPVKLTYEPQQVSLSVTFPLIMTSSSIMEPLTSKQVCIVSFESPVKFVAVISYPASYAYRLAPSQAVLFTNFEFSISSDP